MFSGGGRLRLAAVFFGNILYFLMFLAVK